MFSWQVQPRVAPRPSAGGRHRGSGGLGRRALATRTAAGVTRPGRGVHAAGRPWSNRDRVEPSLRAATDMNRIATE
jgi:hypothetical protein